MSEVKDFLEGEVSFEESLSGEVVWILPNGEKVELQREHERYVRNNPDDFGLTKEDIEQAMSGSQLNSMATMQGAVRVRSTNMAVNVGASMYITDEAFETLMRFLKVKARTGTTNLRMDVLKKDGSIGTEPGTVDVRRLFDHDQSIRHFAGNYNDILS